ncbi:MAG: tail fiber domain-containing protein [Bacteroidales bacterium]|nr:tail fiber domain-containing protein [Bacteroidales bacterium]
MRKMVFSILLSVMALLLFADVPPTINFQGAVKDENGQPLNDIRSLQFRIYDVETGGTPLWSEDHAPVEIVDGIFSVELGSMNPFPTNLFDASELYITFTLSGIEVEPRQVLNSVPFSLKAGTADVSGDAVMLGGVDAGMFVQFTTEGNIEVDGDVTANTFYGDGSGLTGIEAVPDEDWTIDGANVYRLDGNVGIGLNNPLYPLHVSGDAKIAGRSMVNFGSGASPTFTFGDGSEETGLSSPALKEIALITDGVTRMRITDEGDVGIGVTSPNAKLEVAGHISQSGLGGSTFLGDGAGENDDLSDNQNVFIGNNAGNSNTIGIYNTAAGYNSLNSNTEGIYNVAFGMEALNSNEWGSRNTAIGTQALYYNVNKELLVAVGSHALYHNGQDATEVYHATHNTAVGGNALFENTTGYDNTALGRSAMYSNTTGYKCTAIGYKALYNNIDGYNNTAIGRSALSENTLGSYNTALGYGALSNNSEGTHNVALGSQAMLSNTDGSDNIAIGGLAMSANMTGNMNVAIGRLALHENVSGERNTVVGYIAMQDAIGYNNSTAIGYNADPGASNSIRLGNTSVSTIGGYANWTNVSDKRFKTNVKENVPGLDFVMKLRPVTYQLDMDAIAAFNNTPDSLRLPESEQLKGAELQTGFIAQEVEQVANSIGFDFHGVDKPKNENSSYGLRYSEFVMPLVKSVQEQQALIEEQQEVITGQQQQIDKQEDLIRNLEKRIANLEKTQ